MKNCGVCNEPLPNTFKVREMMLGKRDEFAYAQCPACKTIQLTEPPLALDEYYPDYYYSFKHVVPKLVRLPFIKRLFGNSRIKKKYRKSTHDYFRYLKPLNILPKHKILDIGCGKGKLVCEMFNAGFTNIQGVDKFVTHEYDYGYGVKILRKDLSELEQRTYDLLMMHHAFEHMPEPKEELKKAYSLLKGSGHLIIRIPVVGKAWELYQADWVQIDAPRHFFLHTINSIKLLAKQTGFSVDNIIFDSTGFQFWGSELYKRDISLVIPKTKEYINAADYFSQSQLDDYEQQAHVLNDQHNGDQAIFYLRKV